MRCVETKTPEQQACLMLHPTRHLFVRQQTSVINTIRAHMAEFGIVARVGRTGVEELLAVAADPADRRLPEVARTCVAALGVQLRMLKAQILEFDRRIRAWHQSNQTSKRLDQVPGIGPALATALVASVTEPLVEVCCRQHSPHEDRVETIPASTCLGSSISLDPIPRFALDGTTKHSVIPARARSMPT
jgi:transposase